MATFEIKKATRSELKARVALIGVSGSGKTYDALLIAAGLARRPDGTRGRIIVIDTENRSASKYADDAALGIDFDVMELDTFAPDTYVEAIRACEAAGAASIVIDSLSHAWMGKDGALEMKDKATAASRSGNSFDAWRTVTPKHNALVDALLRCKAHLVATMRAKTEYLVEEVNGRKTPRKVGLAPVQRDGLEYEFDVVAEVNADHQVIITKSRCSALAEVGVYDKADVRKMTVTLRTWLSGASPNAPSPKPATTEPAALPQPAPLALPSDAGPAPSEAAAAQPSAPAPSDLTAEHEAALEEFYARVAEIELPGEATVVWMKHRAALSPIVARERENAWKALCSRVEEVGKMKNAKLWLKKAIAEEDARRAAATDAAARLDDGPDDDPPPNGPRGRRKAAASTAPADATGAPADAANDPQGAAASAWEPFRTSDGVLIRDEAHARAVLRGYPLPRLARSSRLHTPAWGALCDAEAAERAAMPATGRAA